MPLLNPGDPFPAPAQAPVFQSRHPRSVRSSPMVPVYHRGPTRLVRPAANEIRAVGRSCPLQVTMQLIDFALRRRCSPACSAAR